MQDPIVEKPEAWPWSSFLHDATRVEATMEIEPFWTGVRRDGLRDPRSQKRDLGHTIVVVHRYHPPASSQEILVNAKWPVEEEEE